MPSYDREMDRYGQCGAAGRYGDLIAGSAAVAATATNVSHRLLLHNTQRIDSPLWV
jgi:hypothetical protein